MTRYKKDPLYYNKVHVHFKKKKVLFLPIRDVDHVLDVDEAYADFTYQMGVSSKVCFSQSRKGAEF